MKKRNLIYGLIGGLASIIVSFIFYFIEPSAFLQYAPWMGLFIYIIFMYKASSDERVDLHGYGTFRQLFIPAFHTGLIMVGILTIFGYLMYYVIDPGLFEIEKKLAMDALEKMRGLLGDNPTDMALDEIAKQESKPILRYIFESSFRLIWPVGICGLVIALILRKKQPEGMIVEDSLNKDL